MGPSRRFAVLLAFLIVTIALTAPSAWAAPSISLKPKVGPPTSKAKVSGAGFAPGEKVDIYFDINKVGSSTAGTGGAFSKSISVPGSAQPGSHLITAVGETSLTSSQKAFTVRTDWAGFHNTPDHAGVNPYENTIGASNVTGLDEDWSLATGGSLNIASVVVSSGTLFVGSFDGKLYAADANTGKLKWTAGTAGSINSTPAVGGGMVFVTSDQVYAFPVTCSNPCNALWAAPIGTANSSPTYAGGVLYVGGRSPATAVYALNPTTGATLWKGPITADVLSSPAVAGGVVSIGAYDDKLYAFDAGGVTNCGGMPKTCQPLWTSVDTGGVIDTSPAMADGMVFIGNEGGFELAFPASCSTPCSPTWSVSVGGGVFSTAAVAGGKVYVGGPAGLYALTEATGGLLWTGVTGQVGFSSPAMADGLVYVGSEDHRAYAFNASGCGGPSCAPLWTATTGGNVASSPAVANGIMYIGSDDGLARAYDLKVG